MNTKVVILAAGVGSRLRPITYRTPKCMVTVNGIPILGHQIEAYKNAGIEESDIIVLLGYLHKVAQEYLEENYPGVLVVFNHDYATTNNMYSLYLGIKNVKSMDYERMILSNGDCVYQHDIIRGLTRQSHQNLICAEKGIHNDESMKIVVGTRVKEISKQITTSNAWGVSIDCYMLSADAVNKLHDIVYDYLYVKKDLSQWSEVAINDLFASVDFQAYDIGDKRWIEIDDLKDLVKADNLFSDFNFDEKEIIISDLDGTLCLGEIPIPTAIDFINKQTKAGRRVYFLTNNTSKTPVDYYQKLKALGANIESEDQILTPLKSLENILKEKKVSNIYLVANDRVTDYITKNFKVNITLDRSECEALVLTYDNDITYKKLAEASLLLQENKDLLYIATHKDVFCPTENGNIPDIGTFIQVLESTTGRSPGVVLGKPDPSLLACIDEEDKAKIVVIGDRLYTDKKLASNFGCDFVLVLTGDTSRVDLDGLAKDDYPALVLGALGM